jgi:hypothetical protein
MTFLRTRELNQNTTQKMSYTPTPTNPHPYDPNTPPLPPPKPASHETSRHGTPLDAFSARQPPFPTPDSPEGAIAVGGAGAGAFGFPGRNTAAGMQNYQQAPQGQDGQRQELDVGGVVPPPPGWDDEYWVPDILKDKSYVFTSNSSQSQYC